MNVQRNLPPEVDPERRPPFFCVKGFARQGRDATGLVRRGRVNGPTVQAPISVIGVAHRSEKLQRAPVTKNLRGAPRVVKAERDFAHACRQPASPTNNAKIAGARRLRQGRSINSLWRWLWRGCGGLVIDQIDTRGRHRRRMGPCRRKSEEPQPNLPSSTRTLHSSQTYHLDPVEHNLQAEYAEGRWKQTPVWGRGRAPTSSRNITASSPIREQACPKNGQGPRR